MSEQQPERTGFAVVDEVLASVDGLAEIPVGEHPAVFGTAHETLRRALDAEPEA